MTLHQQLREALDRKLAATTAAEREDAAEAFGRLVKIGQRAASRCRNLVWDEPSVFTNDKDEA